VASGSQGVARMPAKVTAPAPISDSPPALRRNPAAGAGVTADPSEPAGASLEEGAGTGKGWLVDMVTPWS
jgi:hypothetical protein